MIEQRAARITDLNKQSERLSFAVLEWIHEQVQAAGGLGIFPHPYWLSDMMQLPEDYTYYIYEKAPFDAFEVLGGENFFSHNGFQTALYYKMRAEGYDVPVVGSTDSHGSTEHNRNGDICSTIVFAKENTTEAILDAVKTGKVLRVRGRLEINRYDGNGNQIMDATGAMHMCNRTLGEIQVTGMVDPDCSFASVNFDPDGKTIDEEKIGQFLCQDCLDDFATSCHGSESISPIAVVNFKHRYLAALNERTPWLMRKDYLVTVNYDEDGSIGVVAVYNPPRFQENDGIQR